MYSDQEVQAYYNQTQKLLKRGENFGVEEIKNLRDVLRYHEWHYYVSHDPIISDQDYDLLFNGLKVLESQHPELVDINSPTQRVSSDLNADFEKVGHLKPLLSLANAYNREDLLDFDKQLKKLLELDPEENLAYHVEPKLDGISLAVNYENDQFIRAATRGNGEIGDEITTNVRTIKSLPLKAAFSKHGINKIELRGEAYMRISDFNNINNQRGSENLSLYANPRNIVSGSLRMKNPQETAERNIELVVYQINSVEPEINIENQSDSLELIKSLGFKTPRDLAFKAKSINEVIRFTETAEAKRAALDYEIDGLVIKLENLKLQTLCGSTSHHPRWATAYKFKAKQAHSILENIEYQVGKTGAITPVAKIRPVELAGVTVSSISLHNAEFIEKKDIRLGDTLVVERAGDVIPYIVKSLEELRNGDECPIVFPVYCPINPNDQIKLEKEKDEAAWRCPNCNCGQQDKQRLKHFVSKTAMDIDGLGESSIERFFELGWIKSIRDIYTLDYVAVAELEGYGEKSAEKLKKAIALSKTRKLKQFLSGLSIHHLGKRASEIIANQIKHISELYSWDKERYEEIHDIGPILAEKMIEFFQNEDNQNILSELENLGLNLSNDHKEDEIILEGPWSGKTILFTGTLNEMKRKDAEALAKKLGAIVASSVNKKLDVLVVGEKAGSKLSKAQKIGTVDIIDEKTFISRSNEA